MSDWQSVCIGDIADIPKKQPIANPQAIELLTVRLYAKGVERTGKYPRATERGRPYFARDAGEILIGRQNFHNGGIGIVSKADHGLICSNAITSLIPTDRADKNFLFYLLSSSEFRKSIQKQSEGTGQSEISETKILSLELTLPSLPEQKKIAEILSGIEGVIHRRRSLLEKVTLLASRSFNEVIDRMATEHPIATVESVTTKVIDGPHLTPNYQERGVPFVTVKNISSGKLDLTNTKFITADDHADFCMRGKAEHGDILYSKDGSIGHTCVVPKEYDFSFFVSVALLKTNKELIYPEYLNAVLQSTLIKTQTELMSEGSGLKHMVLRSIKALKIPLPPLDEQIRLMAQLLPVFKSREIIEETIQRMAYFREGIASDLLSGRRRVSV